MMNWIHSCRAALHQQNLPPPTARLKTDPLHPHPRYRPKQNRLLCVKPLLLLSWPSVSLMGFSHTKLSFMMVKRHITVVSTRFKVNTLWYVELFPLWTASKRNHGGLGFGSDEIGIALAYCGCVTLVVQLLVMPKLTKRFGLLRLLRFVLFTLVFLYFSQGLVRYLYHIPDLQGHAQTKFWVWFGLLLSSTIKTICTTIAFTSCTILTNDAAPRLDALGAVNGFTQCKTRLWIQERNSKVSLTDPTFFF